MFNHSPTPNVNYIKNKSPSSPTISFRTVKKVEQGEELCICYSADETRLWFTPSGSSSTIPTTPASPTFGNDDDNPFLLSLGADDFDLFDIQTGETKAKERAKRVEREREVDSARNRRRQKWAERERERGKIESILDTAEGPPDSTASISLSNHVLTPDPTPLRNPIPSYPKLPERTKTNLPPPLHSSSSKRRENPDPAVLCDDLSYHEAEEGPDWGIERVKGPAEMEFEEEEGLSEFLIWPLVEMNA